MSAGLFGLIDDVAVLARLAASTTAKAAGVVIDDTAVTPQYVHGIAAERELPIINRIAIGSLRNKLLLILPAAMLLSQFAPLLPHFSSAGLLVSSHISLISHDYLTAYRGSRHFSRHPPAATSGVLKALDPQAGQ
jgi:hypothetical protein